MRPAMVFTNDDFFKIFGEISVHFATLDALTTLLILRLVRVERIKDMKPINDQTTLGQKFGFFEKLRDDQVYDQDVLKALRQILPRAIELSRERNRYIHDQWVFAENTITKGEIERVTFTELDKWLVGAKTKKFTLHDLRAFREEIDEMQNKIAALVNQLPVDNQAKSASRLL